MKIFAERLNELREEKNLSTKALGKLLGVSDATISRWENDVNEITADKLVKVALFFKVSSDYLLGLENNE